MIVSVSFIHIYSFLFMYTQFVENNIANSFNVLSVNMTIAIMYYIITTDNINNYEWIFKMDKH